MSSCGRAVVDYETDSAPFEKEFCVDEMFLL
jgi:hypothetical protein